MSRDEWAAKYQAGATLEELAMAAGVSSRTVKRHLVKQGVAMRPGARRPGHPKSAAPNRQNPYEVLVWVQKYRAGATCAEIAAIVGKSRAHVNHHVSQSGVAMRPACRRTRA